MVPIIIYLNKSTLCDLKKQVKNNLNQNTTTCKIRSEHNFFSRSVLLLFVLKNTNVWFFALSVKPLNTILFNAGSSYPRRHPQGSWRLSWPWRIFVVAVSNMDAAPFHEGCCWSWETVLGTLEWCSLLQGCLNPQGYWTKTGKNAFNDRAICSTSIALGHLTLVAMVRNRSLTL